MKVREMATDEVFEVLEVTNYGTVYHLKNLDGETTNRFKDELSPNAVLEESKDFKHGDIIQITSYERNCGIDKTTFTALVVDSKDSGLIAIPQDFRAHISNKVKSGVAWETEIDWLIKQSVDIELIDRFEF